LRLLLLAELLYCRVRVATGENRPSANRRTPTSKLPLRIRRIVQLLLVFGAVVTIVDGLVGDRGLPATLRARREYDELAAGIARQRGENARLREEARRLREDPSIIEEIARRELGLIKAGETVFIVKDVPPPAAAK
jgi:cell division protein FtsB